MTPEELNETLDAKNLELLRGRKGPFSDDEVLELMNAASRNSFKFGSDYMASMVQGALLVKLVGMDKSKEMGK